MRTYITFLILLLASCSRSPEQLFTRFREVSISTEVPYSIGNYKNCVFYISFGGDNYVGYMHPDSVSFYRLGRYYTDTEIDSLHILIGSEPTIDSLSVDSPLAVRLAELCAALKEVEAIAPTRLFIEELSVDSSHSIWFKTHCRGYDDPFLVLIADDFQRSLELSQEIEFANDYKELRPSLYFRAEKDLKRY
ncbi:MAG: hypothetical protein IKQ76_00390 [Bacteroidales bacterium]|nr:hypothetical protein [Bacteroidales bacterium]